MRRALLALTVVVMLMVAACGNGVSARDSATSPDGSGSPAVRDLSELKVPVESDGTPAPASEPRQYDVDKMSAFETFGVYYGYSGPWYSQLQLDTGVTPLERSVLVGSASKWSENLLVRNDTLSDIGDLSVQATLLDDAGRVLDVATSSVSIDGIRPGEPVPVALAATALTSDVADVKYDFRYAKSPPAYRQLTTVELRSWPYGQEDRSGIPKEIKVDVGDSYLTVINVANAGDTSLLDVALWVGWIDSNGRLIHFERAQRIDYGQTPEQASRGGDFYVAVSDPTVAKQLADAQQISWAAGVTS
jgi:hypothetical protein